MFITTKNNIRIPLDTSKLTDEQMDKIPFMETVTLYSDYTKLNEIWILELFRKTNEGAFFHKDLGLESVSDIRFDHEPSKDEILWAMGAYGLTLYDVCRVSKFYELDCECN